MVSWVKGESDCVATMGDAGATSENPAGARGARPPNPLPELAPGHARAPARRREAKSVRLGDGWRWDDVALETPLQTPLHFHQRLVEPGLLPLGPEGTTEVQDPLGP